MAPRYLISACLCGCRCRYDGGGYDEFPLLRELAESGEAVAFCPEAAGGLPIPRTPCEIVGERVISRTGVDCTAAYRSGAAQALAMCRSLGITAAILKEKSPSCGSTHVADGTFSGNKIPGMGLTAALLAENGITVYSERALPPELRG